MLKLLVTNIEGTVSVTVANILMGNSDCHFRGLNLSSKPALEKAMVTHSSTLAWKIAWMEEPGRLKSMVSQRVGHD